MFITFLTDFGLEDDFVGTCHGVMKRLAPDVQIIDVTHGIRPGRVPPGAPAPANGPQYFPWASPPGIVAPGAGARAGPLALREARGAHTSAQTTACCFRLQTVSA